MTAVRRIVQPGISVGAVIAFHLALTAGQPPLALACLSVPFLTHAVLNTLTGQPLKRSALAFGLAATFAGLAMVAHAGPPQLARLVVLPPVLINAALAITFGRTLIGNNEPLISRFARLNRGGSLPPQLVSYTRRLTALWMVYFVAMAVLAIAIVGGDLAVWSWVVTVGGPVSAILLFLADHALRSVLYPQFGHHSPVRTIALLIRPDTWSRL